MKFINLILKFLNIFVSVSCMFEKSKYIKEFQNVAALDAELNKTNITIGMMLVYSNYCGHCHTFAVTYEKLAEKYYNKLLFFAMDIYSDYYKRMPSYWGTPYILFFSDGYFSQYKRRRSFEEISYTIDNFYLTRCREITYRNIDNVYYNVFLKDKNKYNNLIIGYFDENSYNDINNFKNTTKSMCQECVGLCYVCKDFKENKNENNTFLKNINNNVIVGYLHNNISKIFLWESNKDNQKLQHDYEDFINNDLRLNYFNINTKGKIYLIDFLNNKNNLIFAYKSDNEKNLYEGNINDLLKLSNNTILNKYNLVLYNFGEIQHNIKFNSIASNGIYEIIKDLNQTNSIDNLGKIEKLFKGNNTKKQNFEVNNKPFIPQVKDDDRIANQNPNDIFDEVKFFKILEKICVVLFTIVLTFAQFFVIYFKYYSKIDENLLHRNNNK